MPHVEREYPYGKLSSYPHLGPADAAIWERYIAANPSRFTRVWYDFRVGDEPAVADDTHPSIKAGWFDLTYWRIDVVAEDASAIYVIEIKPNANSKALGQADSYAMLYEEDEKPSKPVIAVVLTDTIISTTARIAAKKGIELWEA